MVLVHCSNAPSAHIILRTYGSRSDAAGARNALPTDSLSAIWDSVSIVAASTLASWTSVSGRVASHGVLPVVTEQLSAGSEQLASSSEELGAQATELQNSVSRFKVSE
jgi:methyl-accepting chemotaxis protein